MELNNQLLIVVDPGHGGSDPGATFEGRLEKDDNLRMGLAVARNLREQGVNVLMTRDTDETVSLQRRVEMANAADADLFVSLHRNSYIEQTPSTNGVENWIYLTAPEATSGRAAQLVLDQVVAVGVQSNRGVKRGNYYVLRRSRMPAMLFENGYIINEEDNRLFDEKLEDYAAAMVRGILEYFGVPYKAPAPTPTPAPTPAPSPANAEQIRYLQQALNDMYRVGLAITGVYDDATKRAIVRALQTELNRAYGAGLDVDGIVGPLTCAAIQPLHQGSTQANLVFLLQVLLIMNGYQPGSSSGVFGDQTHNAVTMFQRDNYLTPDGVAGRETICRLLGAA